MPHNKKALQSQEAQGAEVEYQCNMLVARIGRWRANLQWRPRPKHLNPGVMNYKAPKIARPGLAMLGLGVTFFTLGAAVALGMTWELFPYVETTRVVGELARLRLGGSVCLVGGLLLFLARKLFHH